MHRKLTHRRKVEPDHADVILGLSIFLYMKMWFTMLTGHGFVWIWSMTIKLYDLMTMTMCSVTFPGNLL